MNKSFFNQLFFVLLLIECHSVSAQRDFFVQASPGVAHCFKTPLTIKQSGYPDLKINAEYKTESWKLPIYYSIKLGTSKEKRGWELELIHLKIYLQNNPPEIQQFQVSHGFNLVQINRTWQLDRVIIRTGAGVVLAHPENIVRGNMLEENSFRGTGYCLAGPCLQISAEKLFCLYEGLYLSAELKTTAAYAWIPVHNGHANTSHLGMHGLVGLGYRFKKYVFVRL
jgi:hypothetical protein